MVSSIAETAPAFARSVNGSWNGQIWHDPIQRVRVSFLLLPGADVQIEFVEPAGEKSPVRVFLEKGGGLHHLCYEVEDCAQSSAAIRQCGGLVVSRPQPAVAFEGRRIAWMFTSEKLLLELLEIK